MLHSIFLLWAFLQKVPSPASPGVEGLGFELLERDTLYPEAYPENSGGVALQDPRET